MRVLVTGASGFVGALLAPQLLEADHQVRALARDPARVALTGTGPHGALEVVRGDALTGEGLAQAMEEIEVAYYLIHSMEAPAAASAESPAPPRAFPERERIAAENFARAAAAAGVRRLIYLGGPTDSWSTPGADAARSRHLASRARVEQILRAAVPDTVTLRASIVIGARSRSFRFLVRLVERMPVLALPAWRSYRTRPIDARDTIAMLSAAAGSDAVAGRSLDVGGPDILSYGEMISRIAELMLVSRPAVGLSFSATPFVSRVAAAIADEDPDLAGALMDSLRGDLLPDGVSGRSYACAAELLGVELHSFDAAVENSLREWEEAEPLAAR